MAADQLLVIPIPHGFAGGPDAPDPDRGLVSLVFLPRLGDRGAHLGAFPGWSVWPDELSGLGAQPPLELFVRVAPQGGQQVSFLQSPIVDDQRPTTSQWWTAVFPDPTAVPVSAFEASNPASGPDGPTLETYPEAAAAVLLDRVRTALWADGNPAPTVGDLRTITDADGPIVDRLPLESARRFTAPRPGRADGDDPELDFHQALSALRRHPEMCRRMGLTVELVLDLKAIRQALPPAAVDQPWELQIFTDWSAPQRPAGRTEAAPAVLIDPATFRPQPGPDSIVVDGQLPLGDDRFVFARGGTTQSLLSLAYLDELDDEAPAPLPPDPANPGVELLWKDRAEYLLHHWNRAQSVEAQFDFRPYNADLGGGPPPPGNPPPAPLLQLDDVAAAYRADMALGSATGPEDPLSLFEREAPDGYFVSGRDSQPALATPPPPDEGWMGTVLATTDGTAAPRLPERLFHWLGWSMAAPLLGTVHDSTTAQPLPEPDPRPLPSAAVQFGVGYEVPDKSLPPLHYGKRYHARVRVVDIAGNSIPRLGEVPTQLSPALFYGRIEKVLPPTVLRRSLPEQPPVPGSSTVSIVLRSQPDQPDDEIPAQDRILFPPMKDPRDWLLVEEPADRHTITAYERFAALDRRALQDQTVAAPGGESIAGTDDGTGGVAPGPVDPVADYLRDPAVAGVRVDGVPGGNAPVLVPYDVPDSTDSHELRYVALRLVVGAGDGPPRVVDTGDVGLHVQIPKACIAALELSSTIVAELVDRFELSTVVDPDDIAAGAWAQISPRTTLDVIHAIPNGRFVPTMESGSASRPGLHATTADVVVGMGVDVPATGWVSLRARWADPVDDPDDPAPTTRSRRLVLGTLPVEYDKDATTADLAVTHDFRDGFRHAVEVSARAIARFTDYFVDPRSVDFSGGDTLDLGGPVVGRTFSLQEQETGQTFREGEDYRLDPEAGTVERAQGGRIDPAVQLTARYAPGPNSLSTVDGDKPTITVVVPNSTVPAMPIVTSVQPAHRRRQQRRWGAQMLRVEGRMLRLRLARPWLVTGDGERLAIIVDRDPVGLPRTTRFGRDPINTGAPHGTPSLESFPSADFVRTNVAATMPDGETVLVDVAGHTPVFDPDRGDWVVDLVVAAPDYRPSLRLAIARFQPDSIPGAALSVVSFLDVVRLGVDRQIAITRGPSATRQSPTIAVTVTGEDHDGRLDAAGGTVHNRVRVTVQEADATISDPDLRWRSTGTVIDLTRTAGPEETTWEGEVFVPPAVGPLRLLIEELEPVVRDDGTGEGSIDDVDLAGVETILLPEGSYGA